MNEIQRLEIIKTAKTFLDRKSFTQDEFDYIKKKLICDDPMEFKATLGDLIRVESLFKDNVLTRDEFDRIKMEYLSGESIIDFEQIAFYKSLLDKELIKKDEFDYLKKSIFQGKKTKLSVPILEALKAASKDESMTPRECDALRIAALYGEATPSADNINKLKAYHAYSNAGYITIEDYDVLKNDILLNKNVCSIESIQALSDYRTLLKEGTIQQDDYDEKKNAILPSSNAAVFQFPDYETVKALPSVTNGKEEKYLKAVNSMESNTVDGLKDAISSFELLGDWEESRQLLEKCQAELPVTEASELKRKAEKEKKRKKNAVIIGIVAAIVLAAGAGALYYYKAVYIPDHKREVAIKLLNEGNYNEAYDLFYEIGDAETMKDSFNSKAIDYIESGEYDKAYALYDKIGEQSSIAASKYDRAVASMDSGDYDTALLLLENLDYKNSTELIEKCYIEKYGAKRYQYYKSLNVGDTYAFGTYEQNNNSTDGKEKIEWIVLTKEDMSVLLISKKALDIQPYNESDTDVTWETCTLREWLNGSFLSTAFSAEEQKKIPKVVVSEDVNPRNRTDSDNSTEDKVFVLSVDEASNYFESEEARKCAPTTYAIKQGESKSGSDREDDREVCAWWLRTHESSSMAPFVTTTGYTNGQNHVVYNEVYVRPVIWVKF